MTPARPQLAALDRLAIVLSGGGERVIAWEIGVLAGLADAGVDARAARAILGTSAGSVAAARLAAGVDPRADAAEIAAGAAATVPKELRRAASATVPKELRRAASEAVPKMMAIVWGNGSSGDVIERRRRAGHFALWWRGVLSPEAHVARQAAGLPDVDWPPRLGLVVVDANTGERLVLDGSAGVGLAEGVAAARAVPGLVSPLDVAGRQLIDGALGSATNADLLPDEVALAIVITATPSGPRPGSLADHWNDALEAERSTLAGRWVRAVVVHASPAAEQAMGDELMSTACAPDAVAAGREQGADLGAELLVGTGS